MIRSLVKLGLVLLVAILVYNYFFGTNEEKAQSQQVFGKARDLVVAGADLIKSEKHKFDAGKYDKVMEQLGGAYKSIRERAQYVDTKVLRQLDELEQRKASLQSQLDSLQENETPTAAPTPTKKGLKANPVTQEQQNMKTADQQRRREQIQREMEQLLKDSDSLLKQAQGQ
ncbi:MAG: hypothetical protein WCR52_17575 [Bacteroidota bacterium]